MAIMEKQSWTQPKFLCHGKKMRQPLLLGRALYLGIIRIMDIFRLICKLPRSTITSVSQGPCAENYSQGKYHRQIFFIDQSKI